MRAAPVACGSGARSGTTPAEAAPRRSGTPPNRHSAEAALRRRSAWGDTSPILVSRNEQFR